MVLVYSKYLCTEYEHTHRGKQNMHSEQQSFVELLHIVLCFIISSSDILFYPYPFYSCHFKYDMLNFIDIWCPQCWTPNIGRFYTNVCAVITKLYTGQQTSMSLQSMKTAWDYLTQNCLDHLLSGCEIAGWLLVYETLSAFRIQM